MVVWRALTCCHPPQSARGRTLPLAPFSTPQDVTPLRTGSKQGLDGKEETPEHKARA